MAKKEATRIRYKEKNPRGKAHRARSRSLEHDLDDIYESLHYREFKIMLKAEDFDETLEHEVHDYWKLARRVATELGIHIHRNDTEMEPRYRDIVFLDTPRFDLYRQGYMLRVRRAYLGIDPATTYELTLKFRGPDIARAWKMDLSPAKGIAGRSKFKEELLLVPSQLGGMRSIFSHTTQLKERREPIGTTFRDFTKIFPHLKTLGVKPTTRMAPAAKSPVQEVLYELGSFGFRGTNIAKVDMAIWRNPLTRKILIGEFAYETHFQHYGRLHAVPTLRSERLYRLLQRHTGSWVELGTTKTSLYYGLSGKKLGHDE